MIVSSLLYDLQDVGLDFKGWRMPRIWAHRRVNRRQQFFTLLFESYEQAKIDEVRNTPVITVVEPPELPARPDPRRLALKGVLGLMLGGMVSVFWAFGREMMATSRETAPDDYAEFARLKEAAKGDVRGLWRRLRRKMGRSWAGRRLRAEGLSRCLPTARPAAWRRVRLA